MCAACRKSCMRHSSSTPGHPPSDWPRKSHRLRRWIPGSCDPDGMVTESHPLPKPPQATNPHPACQPGGGRPPALMQGVYRLSINNSRPPDDPSSPRITRKVLSGATPDWLVTGLLAPINVNSCQLYLNSKALDEKCTCLNDGDK
jgi:hypothetical protein